jgi:hypothetical protein
VGEHVEQYYPQPQGHGMHHYARWLNYFERKKGEGIPQKICPNNNFPKDNQG